uniref:Uncharacterized protein n=1 Tax=Amphilophus citrinellus TaxID=61819 RepID=A0A3Q0SCX3_AMPCI
KAWLHKPTILPCLGLHLRSKWLLSSKCPIGSFSKAAVAADSRKCSEIGRYELSSCLPALPLILIGSDGRVL